DRGLRRAVSGRSAYDAKVIPLDSAKQRRGQRSPMVVRQAEGNQLLHWPRRSSPTPEAHPGAYGRRRRRTSVIKQWLPTALFAGVIVALVFVLAAVRMMLASTSPQLSTTQGSQPQAGAPNVVVEHQPVAAVGPGNAAPQPAPTSTIRFTAKPIEPTYTVSAGDSLWTIAQKNHTNPKDIQCINNLSDGATLSVGQRLVMP